MELKHDCEVLFYGDVEGMNVLLIKTHKVSKYDKCFYIKLISANDITLEPVRCNQKIKKGYKMQLIPGYVLECGDRFIDIDSEYQVTTPDFRLDDIMVL